MSFFRFWKECSCWCLFSLSTVMLLIMAMFILNDLSMVSKHEAMLQQIAYTPIPQLNCVQICQSWYSTETGFQCCDRYNMNLCTAKQQCKIEYVKKTQTAIQIIQNDKFHQSMISGICIMILAMVACRKRWGFISDETEENKNARMKELVKQVIQQLIKQKKIENTLCFPTDEIKYQVMTKISDLTPFEKNQSHYLRVRSDKALSCHLSKEIKSHECQECISTAGQ